MPLTDRVRLQPTEGRSVLHTALRAAPDATVMCGGKNVVPDVHEVLGRMKSFSEKIRSGEWKGATGKSITSFVIIGIGGSYLGPEFVCEARFYAVLCCFCAVFVLFCTV